MTEKSANQEQQDISLSLPAKVTGIVFWGMVLVGLLLAAYILSDKESQIRAAYQSHVLFLEHDIEQLYVSHSNHILDHAFMTEQIGSLFGRISRNYPIEAVRYRFAEHDYQFGEVSGQQEIEQGQLLIKVESQPGMQVVGMKVYLEGLKDTISQSRKHMLMVIGGMVFVFGMVLQQILQKVLSVPILDMVLSAQHFTQGKPDSRFNEQRSDEFGYLAKFINQALDSMLIQQSELEASRRALFEEKVQAEVTLHSIMDGVITTDAENRIRYLNPVAERLFGLQSSASNFMGKKIGDLVQLVHEDTGVHIPPPTEKCLNSQQVEVLESHASLIRRDGAVILIEATAAPMRNDQDEVMGAVMVLQDVSQERKLSRQLSYQASHDMLTGLYNRRMFEEQLEGTLLNVQSEDRHHALCYVDLDQFKIVNDTCGHVAGDELLRQLSVLLRSCVRDSDTLARLGGDEFGILLEDCELVHAAKIAEKVRQTVKDFRFPWEDKSFEVGASIGVVGINAENTDMAAILASADMACYAAKDMGRNRVHVYEPSDSILAERHGQMHWAGRISKAMEEGRLVLFSQPVVNIKGGKQLETHCEVLLRMLDEDGTMVRPDAFIPAAERYNLMPKVDRWVITEVFSQINQETCKGFGKDVAINLSGLTLADDSLYFYVVEEAERYQIDLKRVCFEITETAAISNLSRATQFMKDLKKLGCQFSLDDFGSGLSSFSYLKNLPVDYIKIDGSFVVDMLNDSVDRAMVEAIVRVGHVMDVSVVAEWVENKETLILLNEIGVDYAQGYYLGKPGDFVIKSS